MFRTRVEHLIETGPQLTLGKFRQNRSQLYEEVSARVDKALKKGKSLRKEGKLAPDQVSELEYNEVAPRDVPAAENKLSEDEQIYEWATDPPERKTAIT